MNVAQKIIHSHLVEGRMIPGEEIAIRIDQTLTQDATGTLVMLELEAMGLDRVKTEVSVQYVDHNILQVDNKNPDDHLFLLSACRKFGLWYSPAGNGVSHPVHQERFAKPGKTLLGADSHTPASGAVGTLAIGAGGLEAAMAMAGAPYHLMMPEIWGVKLTGQMPEWVSAKDVILEMLRRHGVDGALGRIIEYYGPGLESLTAMDRHVIANMGAELGATTSIFPSDAEVKRFLRQQKRENDWIELTADDPSDYDLHEEINLSELEPLIAMPTSPGNVKTVREVAGEPIYQAYVGSSANPGYRDFAMAAAIVKDQTIPAHISFDVSPTSRQILQNLVRDGIVETLIRAGARIHQAGCNGCIGMGQAPATKKLSLRTVPRNFPGRSGTKEDMVCLVSPETAAASALKGVITDPRTLEIPYPNVSEPDDIEIVSHLIAAPLPAQQAARVELAKGPHVQALPHLAPIEDDINATVLLRVVDDISTDIILPAGARVLPFRSNIQKISEFAFEPLDQNYHQRALAVREQGGHVIVAGYNYGQGSSREHAALAPRYLGLKCVIAKSFARIHYQNLVNFGVLPLKFENPLDYDRIQEGQILHIPTVRKSLTLEKIVATIATEAQPIFLIHELTPRQLDIILAGGLINWMKGRLQAGELGLPHVG